MRRNGLLVVAFSVALSGLAPAAQAGPGHGFHGHGPGPGARLERILDGLDLEDSQRGEILGIMERYHEGALGGTAEDLRQARRQLRKAIHDPAAGEQQVLEAARVVSARSEQMAVERHRMFVEIGRVLTPDQQAALLEMIEDRDGPGRHWHHGPGPGR